MTDRLTCLEICAGAGGQSLGLERAGFEHVAAVEIDPNACETLRLNRPEWPVLQCDVRDIAGASYDGVTLLAGGVPCPPFSIAGKQLGADDERDLFPEALRLVEEARPVAVMLENVKGLAASRFDAYRRRVLDRLGELGYSADWRVLNASDYGVPQLRPRFLLVAVRGGVLQPGPWDFFRWPEPDGQRRTVGSALRSLMAADGWTGADTWADRADDVAPTLVGGSRKHGGPDLGPTRARQQWLKLGVDGRGLADQPPSSDAPADLIPRLTVPMAATVQGFPAAWRFAGRKTAAYRQVGNAFPPPVAEAVGASIAAAIRSFGSCSSAEQGLRQLLRAV